MDRHRISRRLALLAAVGTVILIVHRLLDTVLKDPLTRLWLWVDAIPEHLIWSTLAIVGFVIVLKFPQRTQRQLMPPRVTPPRHETQVERLAKLIDLGETSAWARDMLRWRLVEMAACLRSLREGIELDQARKELDAGQWPTPQVAAALQRGREVDGSKNEGYRNELALALDAIERYAQGRPFEDK